MAPARVLVVGSGAREHAISAALCKSPQTPILLCFGSAVNPAIKKLCAEPSGYTTGKITDAAAVVAFAKSSGATLAVIGPEAPLETGVADALRAAGIPCVGPSQVLAQIECSKGFALELLERHGVAGVPKFKEFTSLDGAREYLEFLGEGNYVVKADGLCGGKGVKVAGDHLASIDEAVAYCEECLPKFVLCEKLQGEEFSVLSFCDGTSLAHMPPVQDHKRAYNGDTGPNTGGMGAYSCADHLLPFLTPKALQEAQAINGACMRALRTETGELYRGVLYGGFMLTPNGVMLIEYNARLGDPECLNLLSLLTPETDFLQVCKGMACGGLKQVPIAFRPLASCCKYACPEGYPDKPLKGGAIDMSGLTTPELTYLGAVDALPDGSLVATGSRTVGVVAMAADLPEAEAIAEREVSAVKGKLFHRTDVGTAPLVASRVARMLRLQKAAAPAGSLVKVGVLGSTRGSSLQPVLRAISGGELGVSVELVLSNKKDAGILERAKIHGIEARHVPVNGRSREDYDAELSAQLEAAGCQIVLLVGYMRILSPAFCGRWKRRALNIHPSLLPKFAGGMDLEVHSAVLAAGEGADCGVPTHVPLSRCLVSAVTPPFVASLGAPPPDVVPHSAACSLSRARLPAPYATAESGCTVHLVEAVVDAGEIVVQKRCPVVTGEAPESLKARVQALEGPALVAAIAAIASEVRAATADAPPPASSGSGGVLSYKSAGVDIDEGNALVEAIKPMAKSTNRSGVMGSIGGFGGLFDTAAAGFKDPVLVAGTDGVGTKLLIAQQTEKHSTIGIDLVAMVVNDLIVQGAEPLFFLDYFASGKLVGAQAASVLKGIAAGCKESGCALIGGETAEMPGMYAPGHYDLAGFAVGAVERSEVLPKLETIVAGDVLIGLPSSGVHSNGYSLVRKVVEREGVAWDAPAPFAPGLSLADALLTPTKLYIKSCLPPIRAGKVKALSHITGGGLLENLPRVLPSHFGAAIDAASWTPPPVFKWLAGSARSGVTEMLRTFNCGIGMVLIVAKEDAASVLAMLKDGGEPAVTLGSLVPRASADAEQVVVSGAAVWGWADAAPIS